MKKEVSVRIMVRARDSRDSQKPGEPCGMSSRDWLKPNVIRISRALLIVAAAMPCLCSVRVLAANTAPRAMDFDETFPQHRGRFASCHTITLKGTDAETSTANLTFSVTEPSHGLLAPAVGAPTGPNWEYCQSDDFIGIDSFRYTVSDGTLTASATVTIFVFPRITISNVTVTEGQTAKFTVRLPDSRSVPWTVAWETVNGTATPGLIPILNVTDYIPNPLLGTFSLTFQPADTQKTIRVNTIPDLCLEPNETFFVDVASQFSPSLFEQVFVFETPRARCTINNNDTTCCAQTPFFGCVPVSSCLCNGSFIGTVEGIPAEATAEVGNPITYGIQWTVPDPANWHSLSSISIRLSDEDGDVILAVLWDEAANTFNLLDPAHGKSQHSSLPGSKTRFETSTAALLLENSEVIGSGPTGASVLLNLNLSFKPQAAGQTFAVDVAATDDAGDTADFGGAFGTIRVQPKK